MWCLLGFFSSFSYMSNIIEVFILTKNLPPTLNCLYVTPPGGLPVLRRGWGNVAQPSPLDEASWDCGSQFPSFSHAGEGSQGLQAQDVGERVSRGRLKLYQGSSMSAVRPPSRDLSSRNNNNHDNNNFYIGMVL